MQLNFWWFYISWGTTCKSFTKLETCVLVNNNLCGKLLSSLKPPTTFDESFKVIPVPFFIPDFNLLSCELDNFTFKVLYWVNLYWYYIKAKWNYNTFTVPCEKSKIVLFASSIMKNIVALSFIFWPWFRFLVKINLFCCFWISIKCLFFA